MLVEVVELRVTGMKLTADEVAAAPRHVGNLTIGADGCASLHTGERPHLTHSHVLRPLYSARLLTLKGDNFMLKGSQPVAPMSGELRPQAWWCRSLRGDHLPDTPLLKGSNYVPYGVPETPAEEP